MKNVLLIDDDHSEQMFVNFLLRDRYGDDFELTYCSTVEEAKDILFNKRIDVILLDDKLAHGMTSVETIPILRRAAFNVPVVIISKAIDSPHLRQVARLKLNAVVDKFHLMDALADGVLEQKQ